MCADVGKSHAARRNTTACGTQQQKFNMEVQMESKESGFAIRRFEIVTGCQRVRRSNVCLELLRKSADVA